MATKVKKTAGAKPRRRVAQSKREPGTSTISSKNQITIPAEAMRTVGFEPGDRLEITPGPGGSLILLPANESPQERFERGAGMFTGMYGPNYLDELRKGDG